MEHTLKDLTLWNGERGRTYFYQSELPYIVTAAQFQTPGYVSYRVAPTVTAHNAWGVGVYTNFVNDAVVVKVSSFMYRYILRESCSQFDSLPLTSLTNLFTSVVVKSGIVCPKALEKNFIAPLCVKLAQLGGLTHVINDLGAACMGNKTTVEYVC